MSTERKALRPTSIKIDRTQRKLVLPWSDGRTSSFDWDGLREACPCVACRGGHENMGAPAEADVFTLTPVKGYEITSANIVGNYALQITWSDGHNSGIFTWDYLRSLDSTMKNEQ